MHERPKFIQIHWTCGSLEEARKISRDLVQSKLIACASIIPSIESIFVWNNQLESAQETKVIFKTIDDKFEAIKEMILQNAKYEVPEILKITVDGGNQAYLNWVEKFVSNHNCS